MSVKILTKALYIYFYIQTKKLFLNLKKKNNAIKVLHFTFVLKVIMGNWHLRGERKRKVTGKLLKSSLHSVYSHFEKGCTMNIYHRKNGLSRVNLFSTIKKTLLVIKSNTNIMKLIKKRKKTFHSPIFNVGFLNFH